MQDKKGEEGEKVGKKGKAKERREVREQKGGAAEAPEGRYHKGVGEKPLQRLGVGGEAIMRVFIAVDCVNTLRCKGKARAGGERLRILCPSGLWRRTA